MDVEATIHIQANLTPQEYKDVVGSIDRVYAMYLQHFPQNLNEVEPLIAFKNALVLGAQEVKNV